MIKKQTRNRGVSPIVSVILMIVLAILLASVVSGYAFELVGSLLQTPVQAGLSYDESYDASDQKYDVEIVWSTDGTAQTIYAVNPDGGTTARITNVGSSIEITGVEEGNTIRVVGVLDDGSKGVVQEYQVGN